MGYYYNNSTWGTNPAMFAPGSITGYWDNGQSWGSPMPQGLASMLQQGGIGSQGMFGVPGLNFNSLLGGALGLGQLLMGWSQWGDMKDIMEDQLGIQKDRWATTKEELQHLRDTRKRLGSEYMSGSQYSPQTNTLSY